jgi:hypothetical protein
MSRQTHAGIVTLTVAALIVMLTASVVCATPTQVNVRIEGKSETLFEGPIWTEGHDVEASSDAEEHPCDGTNNKQHSTPGPTATAASVDAMGILGETFDGQWYGSSFDDYFVTRWGPDDQSLAESAYWGLLVNNVFTSVGGCQYELGEGGELLWVYGAFQKAPFLALLPELVSYTSGARPLTATAQLGQPFEVEVLNYENEDEGSPPAAPERRGSSPFEGADVSPVAFTKNGLERVETNNSQTVVTDAQGRASIIFSESGWHRIKATVVKEGKEDAIRSNRLDVCVPAQGESGCGEPPAEDQVRTPPPVRVEIEEAETKHREDEAGSSPMPPIAVPRAPEGRSEPRASSSPALAAISENLLASPAAVIAAARVTEDDRWSGLHYQGHWRRMRQSGAWHGTISRGSTGARVSVRLAAGRPVFRLRGTSRSARVEVRAGARRELFAIARGFTAALRQIVVVSRSHPGTVTLRVLKGAVDLDSVAIEP